MAIQKRYDKEFRLGAARLVVEQGYSQADAVRDGRLDLVAAASGTTIAAKTAHPRVPTRVPRCRYWCRKIRRS